ncbi:sigma-70 family RNA polymerase sigma factor [Streptomyces sp. Tue6028]|uniref:sigma-70 family RNA polymerase sigma factor n=1 Tax=Streptomyces sp. Tue6028 TaxID=2036037 RepID=UPI00117C577F|nr:sigma-70 family RNA polymerase sigma factor [Streptomyces sp. Tue6028]
MTAGPTTRGGMGDSSPPERAPSSATEAGQGAPPPIFRAGAVPPAEEKAVLPHQVSPTERDEAVEVAAQLRTEISKELWDHRDRLRRAIHSQGYRDPDLSDIEVRTQVRYYKARMNPAFQLKHGDPWPFLAKCFSYARLDFHRAENRPERPEDPEELPQPAADSEIDGITVREAVDAFLERHVPDDGQRTVWLMTYRDRMGPVAIAEELGIDRGTVTARLNRARALLEALPPDELDHLR